MTHTGTLTRDSIDIADRIGKLHGLIKAAEIELAKALAANTCQNDGCGENLNDHRGYDAACPHPKRFIAGNPLYIEGQYFRGGEL